MAGDPFQYFRVEARELLDGLVRGVLDVEKGAATAEAVAALLRLAHTLKGAARVVKQPLIADHAHAIEEVLDPFRAATEPVPRERLDVLLGLLDAIGARVAALPLPENADGGSVPRPRPDDATRTIRADVLEMDALLDGVGEAHAQLSALHGAMGRFEGVRGLVDVVIQQLAAPQSERAGYGVSGNGASGNGISGNGASGNGISGHRTGGARAVAGQLRGTVSALEQELGNAVELIDRELRQIRDSVERLRLVPAGSLFTDLERAARDVAQEQGKRVVFEASGDDVRLDAHVLSALQTALAQIVRNAVAHGIESGERRHGAGKGVDGHVRLDVVRRGRRAVFTCRDDGQGIDLEAVRRAAHRKGLLAPETDGLSSEGLMHLLLAGGGISTSGTVTEISGRGVGLDIARHSATRLGGRIAVSTESGIGTTVVVEVPLSLASFDALRVSADGNSVLIPLDAVRHTVRVTSDEVASGTHGESIAYDGAAVPFLSLGEALSQPTDTDRARHAWSAVIVEGADGVVALGTHRLLGTSSIVVRALPDSASASPVVAGVWLDTQGNPQLVLDPDGLVAEARRDRLRLATTEVTRPPILVIDDSLTTRMLEQSILESAGYDVEIAASGEEGLQKATNKHYLLFLVDVEMPGIDGFTFIERTRATPALRDVPSILVTSRASTDDRQRGIDVGADAYFTKGEFDQGKLLERIRELTVG